MTKKDYELIALCLKGGFMSTTHELKWHDKYKMAQVFAYELGKNNPRFDKDKFLQACGIEIK